MNRKTKILMGITAALIAGGISISCNSQNLPLETVPFVDLEKYMGKWYEIAAFPQRFQKGCHCTSAEYRMHPDGYVEILNYCRKNSPTGKLEEARGKAFVADRKTNAKLKVQFFWPFKGDYWILDLAADYSYAVVGAPNRKYLWILARKPKIDAALYQQITARIKEKGFDITQLKMADQSCSKK
jgi:apolipoprotein D and lipocalin family protein